MNNTSTPPAKTEFNWMIYGATGYTGKLIAEQAVRLGMRPILAGRSSSIHAIADSLGLSSAKVFDLSDADAVQAALQGIQLVLHCAGPFSATAAPMMAACLAVGCHYLDITGEIAVFEAAFLLHEQAKQKGIIVCPGVGFDVVPTDCLAAALHDAIPDATHLTLGFDSRSGMSPGTAKTAIEGFGAGGLIRRDGDITQVALAYDIQTIDFGFGPKTAMTIPWGDVSTAFRSTGIPNIACYMACPPKLATMTRRLNLVRPLLKLQLVQALMKWNVDRKVRGPSEATRAKLQTAVWGEVRNAKGDCLVGRVTTANGYSLTIDSALAIVSHIMAGDDIVGGFYTPSKLCGWHLVETLPGSGKVILSKS